MPAEEYQEEADNNTVLQKKDGNVIKDDNTYHNQFHRKRYNYIYDPFDHKCKWITYEPEQISNGRAKDLSNDILMRVEFILAALKKGL